MQFVVSTMTSVNKYAAKKHSSNAKHDQYYLASAEVEYLPYKTVKNVGFCSMYTTGVEDSCNNTIL